VRVRHLLVFGLVAMAAAGEGWHLWTPAGRMLAPETGPVHAGTGVAVTAPTAADEADLLPAIRAAHSPRPLPDVHRQRDVRSARTDSFVSPPQRPSHGSATTPLAPVTRPVESPPQSAPPLPPSLKVPAEPATPASGVAPVTSPAAESAEGSGQQVAQETAGPASPDASAAGGHGTSPSPSVGGPATPPASNTGAPPRLVSPRVIDTAGTEYPGEAFHLTLRRQDLGSELVVQGAEGTVTLRALIAADGSVRSVDVATSSGSPVLDRAAAEAVRRWRFAPATRDGVPIEAYAILRIRYVVR
jgi:periplasmic protein TonB